MPTPLRARLIPAALVAISGVALAGGLALAQTTAPASAPAADARDLSSPAIAARVVAASGGRSGPTG